jgi:hypothetical protein
MEKTLLPVPLALTYTIIANSGAHMKTAKIMKIRVPQESKLSSIGHLKTIQFMGVARPFRRNQNQIVQMEVHFLFLGKRRRMKGPERDR